MRKVKYMQKKGLSAHHKLTGPLLFQCGFIIFQSFVMPYFLFIPLPELHQKRHKNRNKETSNQTKGYV
jgi:hypothetical protein